MDMKKLKKEIKNPGINSRIVIAFTALVFVPFILLSFLAFIMFQNYVTDEKSESAIDTATVVSSEIVSSMRRFEQSTMGLYYGEYLEYMKPSHKMDESEKRHIQAKLNSMAETETEVFSVVLRLSDGSVMYGGNYYTGLNTEKYKDEIIAREGKCCWFCTAQPLGYANGSYILARSLNAESQKNVAILYYVLRNNMISNICDQLTADYQYTYVTDESGNVFYASDYKYFSTGLDLSSIDKKVKISSQTVRWNDQKYILVAKKMMAYNWYCINLVDVDELVRDARIMVLPFFGIAALYIVFMLVMIRLLNHYVFRPLKELKKNMDQYATDNLWPAEMTEVGIGEFRSLSRHFNSMTRRIDYLMKEYKRETDEKNQLQLNMMASQLTPHFVYNALNTIKWMAVLNHQDQIRKVTESLVYIFMNATRTEDEKYTLHDELELVKNYAVIQKVRFMNFDLEIEVSPEEERCHIRKLMLQPIVENAIVHGLARGRIKDTKIIIRAWSDEYLHIEVKDFGIGFDVEKWRKEGKIRENHTNIGIHHVEKLIQLEFGEPYCLQIESEPDAGTTVRYLLPIVRLEEEKHDTDDHCG